MGTEQPLPLDMPSRAPLLREGSALLLHPFPRFRFEPVILSAHEHSEGESKHPENAGSKYADSGSSYKGTFVKPACSRQVDLALMFVDDRTILFFTKSKETIGHHGANAAHLKKLGNV